MVDYKMRLNDVRFSYAHLIEPKQFENSNRLVYCARILIEKGSDAEKVLMNTVNDLMCDTLAWEAVTGKSIIPDNIEKNIYTGQKGVETGMLYINARTSFPIEIIDKDERRLDEIARSDAIIASEDLVYSGMWGDVFITAWLYHYAGKFGVSYNLGNILKTKDDENLGRPSAVDEFFGEVKNSDLPF